MKTPEEIKKGLEIAVNGCLPCDRPITDCPYDLECRPTSKDTNVDIPKQMAADAIAYIKQLENHIRDLTKKVKQLEVAQPRWINVEERLPYDCIDVLVFTRSGYTSSISIANALKGRWFSRGIPFENVTHWMLLPESPKEGE